MDDINRYNCDYERLSAPLGGSEEAEEKIVQLFALGMNYANIQQEIQRQEAINLSKEQFNYITAKLVPAF